MPEEKAPPPRPRRRMEEPPKQEGLPEWMATFADMVTLLLCFFILLLSFAQQDANKFKTLMGSIKEAFGIQVKRPEANFAAFSPTQFERKDMEIPKEDELILGMVVEIKNMSLEDSDLQRTMKIASDGEGVVMRFPASSFFEPGSADMLLESLPLLEPALKIMRERNVKLVVRGHTSDKEDPTSLYPSNWELSAARAAAILHSILERSDIPASRLKAVGYADSRPLLPNNTEQNRETNERMELYLHKPEAPGW